MEKKSKIIIFALIIIIVVLLIGIFATMPQTSNKQDTNLTFKCKSTINEGDSIKIQLTDANGTAIANQSVNVTITDKNNASDYHSVVTNSKGIGTIKIDKNAGNYIITIKYDGNDNYTGCNATKKIKIKEKQAAVQQSSASSSASNDNDDYYNGYSRSDFSEGQQAAIDEARAHGYSSTAEYYKATGKTAGQDYLDSHPEGLV